MDIRVKTCKPEKQRVTCVVLAVFERRRLSTTAQQVDEITAGYIREILRRSNFGGKLSQTLMLYDIKKMPCDRILLIGCGKESDIGGSQYQRIISTMVSALSDTGVGDAVCYLCELNIKDKDIYWKVRQTVESCHHTIYRFDQLKTQQDKTRRNLQKLIINTTTRREQQTGERALKEGNAIALGSKLARDLGNLPGNICTPTYLSKQASKIAKTYKKLKVNVLGQKEMENLGMGALLSVAKGSRQPPKLIVMVYKGDSAKIKPYVLVGKGITFDSGGISIKPSAAMDEMKFDMCGAASVLGTLTAIGELQPKLNVVGIIPTCENLPDGNANKPGDIVTSMSGQTIEILNTDAEGRLILCDALTYSERFDPKVVIDIATLTGACVIALGKHASGLLSNHAPLADAILSAGLKSGDRAWEMPLWEEYQDQIKTNFADMANVGGREAGTITAACFLSRFTKKLKWAHLDIAGVAWETGSKKGATGRPVPLLTQYLLDHSK